MANKTFTLKTYGTFLYKWSPDSSVKKNKLSGDEKPFYCDATAGSNGQDWIVSYCYDIAVVNGQKERLAYVACGYVE